MKSNGPGPWKVDKASQRLLGRGPVHLLISPNNVPAVNFLTGEGKNGGGDLESRLG